MHSALRTLLALAIALVSVPGRSAETDQYYAWRRPVADSTLALNAKVNETFELELSRLNRLGFGARLSCDEVARAITAPFFSTGYWFFVGATKQYGFVYAPRSNTEYRQGYRPVSIYRHAPWLQLGLLMPLDPTLHVGGVNIGTDKLGHFFPNGQRYYARFQEERARGKSEEEALRSAIRVGIEQEAGILGGAVSGIFSFADLEANYQGLRFFRALCDEENPLLVRDENGWRLTKPFDIRSYVNPCWDETWYHNAYLGGLWPSVKQGLEGYCSVRHRPHVVRQRLEYERRGCQSESVRILDELSATGELPDPRRYSLDEVCRDRQSDRRSDGGG